MDEREMLNLLINWLGIKRILELLAEFEKERGLANRERTGMYWDAKHNAELLCDTANSLRG